MELRVDDLPKGVDWRSLSLGTCPHGVDLVTGKTEQSECPRLDWTFTSHTGTCSSTKSRDLHLNVKVSLLWGLVKANVDVNKLNSSLHKKDSVTIISKCTVQKGIQSLKNAKPIIGCPCNERSCEGEAYYVSDVGLGAEAKLMVNMDCNSESSSDSSDTKVSVEIFNNKMVDTMKSFVSSHGSTDAVMTASYSTSQGEHEFLKSSTYEDITKFFQDVEGLEERMLAFPQRIAQLDYCESPCKFIFQPVACVSKGLKTDGRSPQLESRVRVEEMLQEFEEVLEEAGHFQKEAGHFQELLGEGGKLIADGGDDLDGFVRDIVERLTHLVEVKKSGVTDDDRVKRIYGNRALNYYRRQLRRLKKKV